jgi:hypothetical protein
LQILDLFGEDSWRIVYAGELEVRPPGAPTTRLDREAWAVDKPRIFGELFEAAPYGLFGSRRVVILPTRRTQRMRRPRESGRRMSSDCRRSACYWVERISLSSRSLLSTLNTPNVVRATVSAFRRSTSELTTPVRVTWPFSTTT